MPRKLGGGVGRSSVRLGVVMLASAAVPAIAAAGATSGSRALSAALRFGPGVANHPVGVVPSSAVRLPEGWPVAADGSITCVTCHEEMPSLDGTGPPSLRGDDEREGPQAGFCRNCHSEPAGPGSTGVHWQVARFAHIRDDTHPAKQVGPPRFDFETQQCLSCHDGVTAREAHNETPWNRSGRYQGDPRGSHPIGVAYPHRGQGRSSVAVRPARLLSEKIRLPEGRVGCVSCHDLYALGPHRLTVPIDRSALCFSCHAMD